MATVAQTPTRIQHYASLTIGGEDVYGIATLIAGGYSFRPDDSREVRLVSYKEGFQEQPPDFLRLAGYRGKYPGR